ncbi:hypothetical protein L7F22_019036 [Adiantum nelumboides]|nr:hypothetical protein [Adiantum nelumboides]
MAIISPNPIPPDGVLSAINSSVLPPESIARALPDNVPENAPAHCPGTESEDAGKASACDGCPNQSVCASTPKDLIQIYLKLQQEWKGYKCSNWRGPKKNGLIKQFLLDVDWTGGLEEEEEEENNSKKPLLDYMLIDTPPGTSDEHLSIVSLLRDSGGLDGAVLLTTPQEVSLQDVRKEISFCRKVNVPILGIVENMAGFVCPACHGQSDIFYPSTGGAKALCEELNIPFLGSVPLDPRIGRCCDLGESFVDEYPESPASKAYMHVIDQIKSICP